jgi:hypothetical protein
MLDFPAGPNYYKQIGGRINLTGISIEPFRGDYEALEQMAFSAWRDEYGDASFPNLYQPDYLKFLFKPVPDKRLLLAAYRGNEIISFLANLPRSYSLGGKSCRGVLTCFLVTRREYLRQGLALAVINEALKLNRRLKYDFALFYLETGHRSSLMIQKLKQAGQPVQWVKKMYVLGRVLDLPRVTACEGLKLWERAAVRILGVARVPKIQPCDAVREYQPKDLDQCLKLLNQYRDKVRLALVWERDELGWELDCPGISETLVYEKAGQLAGLINWSFHQHIGKSTERWAWVNHVAYPGLSGKERLDFVESFLSHIRGLDCVGAVEWTKKYYPMAPFYRAHFFPYFRAVNMLAWNFNPALNLENIPEVYELQI